MKSSNNDPADNTVSVENLDTKNFNFQGLGVASDISGIGAASSTELTFGILPIETNSYSSKITTVSYTHLTLPTNREV